MSTLNYNIYRLNIEHVWELSEVEDEELLDTLDETLDSNILCCFVFHNNIPIIFAFRHKYNIITDEVEARKLITTCELNLNELMRQHICKRVPFIHNLKLLEELD